jgi:hypothetical protein
MAENSTNPFEVLGTDGARPISIFGNESTGARWLPEGELAAEWIRGLDAPNSELNRRLLKYGLEIRAKRNQRGNRWLAVGVDLPLLKDELDAYLRSRGKPCMDQVSFSLGLTLKGGENFQIGTPTQQGFYVGVRSQRERPDGTLPQDLHDRIFDISHDLLSTTRVGSVWHRRTSPDYWSIWTYVGTGENSRTAGDVKEEVLDSYIQGLAALRGTFWQW